ncbi:MAG TPA: 4-(cytidine 5'-diphospho)-2-C-methyl-D-erythritol kinase [Marinospirillum sp.]|uniref:4-(cytidine 5'-diphospho)-2-C-methyl-D-erythritol kinase n=1 Tax=Marinospirillum sp. TaxID=2183934 RepID=UPI002B46A882|nr:4-(cytidine 5'-diphospho)-2-C-methyl-D-erythritol kinase [Marinospirillum sp.]HKM14342.1 4-(cytidine 5'-diphospho)-2-C-methyl-D-erythritol kinase [Marinospirillum sp.]
MTRVTALSLPAPAKINLLLHITGKRLDGYHQLQTLFQFLDLHDDLHFQLTNDGSIRLAPILAGVAVEDNLVMRAAQLLAPFRKNHQLGVAINLQKNLPMGAGLGAGSSDAATTLLALNLLWQLNLDLTQLAALGLQLGADVPVFIFGQTAWAEGIGEQLQSAKAEEATYVLIFPGCHCDTGSLFSHPDLPRNTPLIHPQNAQQHLGENDFEALVRRLYPAVEAAFVWLAAEHQHGYLTGSGASIYCRLDNPAQAEALLSRLPKGFAGYKPSAWVTKGCNQSLAHVKLIEHKGSLLNFA